MSQHTEEAVGAACASVVGNALVAFSAEVDPKHKTELLDLLGFAQLQSVQAGHDPLLDPRGYYDYLCDVVNRVGFEAQDPDLQTYSVQSATLELDQLVMDVLASVMAAPDLAVTRAALDALKSTSTDPDGPWTILSRHASSATSRSFAVGYADQSMGADGGSSLGVELGIFSVTGSQDPNDFLWAPVPSASVGVQVTTIAVTVQDDLWNRPDVGSAIEQLMGPHSSGYIADLPALHVGG